MTSPLDPEPDPDPPGEPRGLESYPEFFAYPIDPDLHATTVIPRFRERREPPYQTPYTPAPQAAPVFAADRSGTAAMPEARPESGTAQGIRDPFTAKAVHPETYIKDKLSAELPPPAPAATPPSAPPVPRQRPRRAAPSRPGGRRRAKRSLTASLWPFQAFRRPEPQNSSRIRSRSTTATVWRRLRADRAAMFGGYTVIVLILLAVFAPVVSGWFGVSPTALHPELTDATFGPHGGFGGMSWAHPLGVDQRLGRDNLARLLFGARVSLLIAGGATLLSVGLGAALGVVSGYLGGRADQVIMRTADVFLAFPLMLFALGLTGALSDQAFGLSGNGLRIAIMIFVMGFFNWPYIARIVRAEVLSLREREFIDAARALGASTRWILWRELLPNLMAPILVYTTLLIPTNIIFEAGLSALGIGLNPPAASWGQMMTDAVATVYTDPEYLTVPGMAVFITVLAFNLFGDGLRNATDPTAQ